EIVLVIVLGFVEDGSGLDFGDDGRTPDSFGVQLADHFLRSGALRLIEEEDGGTVLRADVVPLAIESCGVMNGEEDFEDFAIRGDVGIEDDADGFGVFGSAGADLLVGGIRKAPPDISGLDAFDALHLLVNTFEAPEAATSKNCNL